MLRLLAYLFLLITPVWSLAQSAHFRQLTVDNGLSNNSILSITEDRQGFMWYGTRYGLNRYDGSRFKSYKNIYADTTSISDNIINALLTDKNGVLWIGSSLGLLKYNPETDSFERMKFEGLKTCYVSTLYEDLNGDLLAGTYHGLFKPSKDSVNYFKKAYPKVPMLNTSGNMVRSIYRGKDGKLWIGSYAGLVCFDRNEKVKTYNKQSTPNILPEDYITSVAGDSRGNLWIGTFHGGLHIMDSLGNSHPYRTSTGNALNNIRKIITTRDGKLWVGSQDGVLVVDPVTLESTLHKHDPLDPSSLSNNSIHSIYQDATGTVWIGTYHGGLNFIYSRSTPFETIAANSAIHISNNIVSTISKDKDNRLWIGTEGGGLNCLDPKTGQYTNYKNNPADPHSISSNLIKVVYRDRQDRVWIGPSYGEDLNLYDEKTNSFRRYALSRQNRDVINFDEILCLLQTSDSTLWVGAQSGLTILKPENGSLPSKTSRTPVNARLPNKNIRVLFEDSRKYLWIGTSAGLCRYDRKTDELKVFRRKDNDPASLQGDAINSITEDHSGNIWIGTYYGGLSRYDVKTGNFTTYLLKHGLPNNNILSVAEDTEGNIWCGTDKGLVRYDPQHDRFLTYTTSDGVASNKFNANAIYKDALGKLYLGGSNGITTFTPGNLQVNGERSAVRFTGFRLFGNPVPINLDKGILKKDIDFQRQITLNHDQQNFTIEYALLNFIKPEKNAYAYKLEGAEKEWNHTTATSVTYNNLSPGRYTLLVKGANNDGIWMDEPARLEITVLPPVWQTWYAYTAYALILAAIIFFLLRFFWLRELFKKERELQQFKLNFFTNVSHEIRTLLTLIGGPVERLLQLNQEQLQQRQLQQVKTNTDRLSHLVEELMDFRKAESNNLQLQVSEENIVEFASHIFQAFQSLAEEKNITLSLTSSQPDIKAYIDKRQMEKVIFNLLTNAIKFTPANGNVSLRITGNKSDVQIDVEDNGKGIAPAYLPRLFENFFQVSEHTSQNTGYGIGLALSKSIVELHKGELKVVSERSENDKPGRTCFTVLLRKGNRHFSEEQLVAHSPVTTMHSKVLPDLQITVPDTSADSTLPTILLVEDNAELSAFIRESLAPLFNIVTCENGLLGWEAATQQIPDLVISDVMMPEMDGFTLCRQLKQDLRTCHIPVILLTAKADHENQLEGLTNGADAYVTKPFSIQLLELQTKNLVAGREAMRRQLAKQLSEITPEAEPLKQEPLATISDADRQFIEKALLVIDDLMDDPEFNVGTLAYKMNMSAPILYKKIKALTGLTVNDFIKSLRLKKAAELLLQKDRNVAEVAYMVGFNRKHFTEEFKKTYGKTPSEFIKQ
ncbi:MAG: two-component regulator propeller domain-containing protein [Chitinophagaceae bacterium]